MMTNTNQLPITRSLSIAYTLSLIVAILMAIVSLAGLLFPSTIYPTADVRSSSIPTDAVNLLIVLPALLGSMALARRGRLIGLLLWPGALLIVIYHYIAFAVGALISWQLVPYVALVALSVYAIASLLASIDSVAVRQQLKDTVPARFSGGMLAAMGILFVALVAQNLADPAATTPEKATAVADLALIPALVIGGVLLWRKQPLGYVAGAGLLFLASMLFVGLLIYFILQPLLTGVPFPVDDFVVIAVMSLVGFAPFGLFMRGVVRRAAS